MLQCRPHHIPNKEGFETDGGGHEEGHRCFWRIMLLKKFKMVWKKVYDGLNALGEGMRALEEV